MKKLTCLLLVLCALFPFYSCGSWDLDDLPEATDIITEPTDVPQSPSTEPASYAVSSKNHINTTYQIASAPGMIVFSFSRIPMYYNTATGKCYRFCFDPSCKHMYNECVNNKLMVSNKWVYSNGKLYVAYTDRVMGEGNMSGIAAVPLDATSIDVLHRCNTMYTKRIDASGDYVYLLERAGTNNVVIAYNVATGEAVIHRGNGRELGNFFLVADNKLVYSYKDDPYMYGSDLDFTNEKELFPVAQCIYSDNKLYHCIEAADGNGEEVKMLWDLYEYNMESGEDKYVTRITTGISNWFCVADGYLYYTPIGKYAAFSPQRAEDHVTISGGEICRVDLSTGEVKSVFLDKYLDFQDIFSINGRLYASVINTNDKTWLGKWGLRTPLYGELTDADGDGTLEFALWEWDSSETPEYLE